MTRTALWATSAFCATASVVCLASFLGRPTALALVLGTVLAAAALGLVIWGARR